MPTVDENIKLWGPGYHWEQQGDEWSARWGGADMQWYGMMLTRIHLFLPAHAILEIAPGFGRWTQFIKDQCQFLTVVDLNANCIDYCKNRFKSSSHIAYHVNDGKSLAMIPDHSIDCILSFDSLVHAEADVIDAYLGQFPRILKPDGVAVIHHSNFGAVLPNVFQKTAARIRGLRTALLLMGIWTDYVAPHSRGVTMTAAKFLEICNKHGLACISQETLNWSGNELIDCISVLTTSGSRWRRPLRATENYHFRQEAALLKSLAPLYGRGTPGTAGAPGSPGPAGNPEPSPVQPERT